MKILVVDDHAVVRQGAKQILIEHFAQVVVGEAEHAEDMFGQLRRSHWDLIILDIGMPGKGGLEALKELKRLHPKLPVLILSAYPEDQLALRLLRAGAAGYLSKDSAPRELLHATKRILAGGRYISASLADLLAANLENSFEKPLHEQLSDREYQVMCLIAVGKSLKDIADELSVSVSTVNTYRARILEKMRVRNNTELTHYALENRLVNRIIA